MWCGAGKRPIQDAHTNIDRKRQKAKTFNDKAYGETYIYINV